MLPRRGWACMARPIRYLFRKARDIQAVTERVTGGPVATAVVEDDVWAGSGHLDSVTRIVERVVRRDRYASRGSGSVSSVEDVHMDAVAAASGHRVANHINARVATT